MVASIVQLLNSTVRHPDSFCFFNSLSLAIDFPPHVCDFLVTRWLLCQTSETHSRQKMWSGKGERESIESVLSVPLCIIKARVLQEAPSIVLHWYLSDKIYFTWPLLPTKSPNKLLNSLLSFYRRRQEKIKLRKITLQSPPHISTSFVSASLLFILLFSKLSQRRKFIYFILLLLNNEFILCYEFSYEDSSDNIPWVLI